MVSCSAYELTDDLSEFNKEVDSLNSLIKADDIKLTKESLVRIRCTAMDIETIFSNLIEEIDTIFQNSDIYDE